ncbi:MAG: DNA/RNA non-specific endonuclease [Bacteroidota bacterium]|nr:DNA/RNA non-specific endonuclease [Bacteroidota bacterium]
MIHNNLNKLAPLIIIGVLGSAYLYKNFNSNKQNATNQNIEGINKINTSSNNIDSDDYFLPTSTTNQVIKHNTYYLSYSEEHEQAEWVAYILRDTDLVKNKYKRPLFIQDEKVKTGSAHWNNYKNSGYTRGHLLPAADRTQSEATYNETFLTSNISPQLYEFNAGIWNSLEHKTRLWAKKYKKIYVVTGGILNKNLKTIGNEQVSVPDYFYKILLREDNNNYKMIAFVIPHQKNENNKLPEYVVTADDLEKQTNIDFFPFLDDKIEHELESTISADEWFNK